MARVLDLENGVMIGEERAGEFIEKYELLRPVAQGGMGSVWAAKLHGPHGFEKLVAVKTVLPELAGDRQVRAMFLDEANLASAIVHRNVAHVLDFLEHQGALYIVMEWVDGVSLMWLHERLETRGALVPAGIVLRVLADACAGLHAAHNLVNADGEACGLVHRDVSPHNILVASEGAAKLIDFGVAKTRFRVAADSTLGQLRGRLAFMAPEQAQNDALDRRADVWSIGASLYYLLTGHGPFGPCGGVEALRNLLQRAQPLPPPPYVHRSVARVLSGCLARRREERFPTAEQVGWAIEEALDDMGVAASARDVAAFVEEQAGDHIGPRRFDIGRCMTTNRAVAVPRELTVLLQSGSLPVLNAPRPTRRRRATVAVVAAACASLSGMALGFALTGGTDAQAAAAARTSAPVVLPEPAPEQAAKPPVEAPPSTATEQHEEAAPVLPAQATHVHVKRRHVVRPDAPKPGSRHDGLGRATTR